MCAKVWEIGKKHHLGKSPFRLEHPDGNLR
jgi:hypothetical protein